VRRPQPAGEPLLLDVYERLDAAYGGERWHWMPEHVDTPLDVIAGAVLVQHTSWLNAERALESLRTDGALRLDALAELPEDRIAALVRVSGTPTVKARRLRAVAGTISERGGLDAFLALPREQMRDALLATHGIGPETADAILLYAAQHPAFVIDAYTQRLFRRLGTGPEVDSYDAWQQFFERELPRDLDRYRRYHAWIVLHGKDRCRASPRCTGCPLLDRCAHGRANIDALAATTATG
jgi:endonuclease-3 related protein